MWKCDRSCRSWSFESLHKKQIIADHTSTTLQGVVTSIRTVLTLGSRCGQGVKGHFQSRPNGQGGIFYCGKEVNCASSNLTTLLFSMKDENSGSFYKIIYRESPHSLSTVHKISDEIVTTISKTVTNKFSTSRINFRVCKLSGGHAPQTSWSICLRSLSPAA